MHGDENGAFELKHCGKIHRASNFSELKNWVLESRVSAEDSFRAAGSKLWVSIMDVMEFAAVLNPDNQWVVTMKTGVFKTVKFDTIVKWAEDGRITEDAVVEGPRTPPGGVKASALPAIASLLRKPGAKKREPVLRIDGQLFPAPDAETIRLWIKSSRVPLEAEISLQGKSWQSVSNCGLFDLEDWPQAAHGRVEENDLPDMPDIPEITVEIKQGSTGITDAVEETVPDMSFNKISELSEENDSMEVDETFEEEIPYTVISGNSEMTIESVAKLKSLLKKKLVFSYDEIRHPSIDEETISVGEFLAGLKSDKKSPLLWILVGIFLVILAVVVNHLVEVPFLPVDLLSWI